MNATLNNQLVDAIQVLKEEEQKFSPQIKAIQAEITQCNQRIESIKCTYLEQPTTPDQMYQKQQLSMILLLIFVWPVGIPYAIHFACTKKKRTSENNKKYVEEMTEYEKKIDELRSDINEEYKKIENLKSRLNAVQAERDRFLQENDGKLSFLPKYCRKLEIAKSLYHMVHNGFATTLPKAIDQYYKNMQELMDLHDRIEEKQREEELAEKRHKEIKQSLDNIEYYQKRSIEQQNQTNEALDRIHQDNLRGRF